MSILNQWRYKLLTLNLIGNILTISAPFFYNIRNLHCHPQSVYCF